MKKVYLILVSVVILILLVFGASTLYEKIYPEIKDGDFNQTYPALKDYKSDWIGGFNDLVKNGTFIETEDEGYRCSNGKTATLAELDHKRAPEEGIAGGWSVTYVIDCEDYYYIYEFPGFPGDVYGPFEK